MSGPVRAVLALGCAASAVGCSLLGLRSQLQETNEIVYYTGTVTRSAPGHGPILVVLYSIDAGREIIFYDIVPREGRYHLVGQPGGHAILAFEDTNRDFSYQPGEPVAHLQARPVNVRHKKAPSADASIVIPAQGGVAPDFAIDLSPTSDEASVQRRAGRVGAVTTLADPRFDKGNVENGIYRPMYFLRDAGPGLFLLEPYDPNRIPVIFVHGMDGSPRDWAAVIDGVDRSRYQPWVYYWPTGMPLQLSAWHLDQALEELRSRLRFARCVLIAHSMGGLVSRGALNFRLNDGRPLIVERFITISTPWKGHAAAGLGVKTAPIVVPAWRDMAPGSEYLNSLFAVPFPAELEYSMLFSHHGRSMMTPGKDDGTVSVDSMLAYEAEDAARFIYGLSEDHVSILSSPKTLEKLNLLLADRPVVEPTGP